MSSNVLDPLVSAYRGAHGHGALTDARMGDIENAERQRARDAAALGELLAPLLVEKLEAAIHRSAPAGPTPETAAPPDGRRPSTPASAPEIADLLDGMLRQRDDAAPRRRGRSAA